LGSTRRNGGLLWEVFIDFAAAETPHGASLQWGALPTILYFTTSSVPQTGIHSLSLDANPDSRPSSRFIATVSV
jgi:hypothetical protein